MHQWEDGMVMMQWCKLFYFKWDCYR